MDTETSIRIVAGLLAIGVLFIPAIFYLLTLSRALEKCSPASRTMQPGMVWLMLIPFFGLIWNFFIVLALSNSLGREFPARGVTQLDPEPGKSIGLPMCVCMACGIIPLLGVIASLIALVLWVVYWVKIAGFSRLLDQFPAQATVPTVNSGF
ncbi:MAG: hypothetical protein ABSE36_12330 [Terracidiphilus sp.]|jgi:hypothetical protein